jgi:hypothetical protein
MDNGPFEIQYVYSFLLSPLSIGVFADVRNLGGTFPDLADRLAKKYEEFNRDGGPHLSMKRCEIHMSEERVPSVARLPLYHRFPHISIEYSMGCWQVQKFVRCAKDLPARPDGAPGFTEVAVGVSAFVFESGAGLLGIRLSAPGEDTSLKVGPSFSSLANAMSLADFQDPSALTDEDGLEFPYALTPPEALRERDKKYHELRAATLHDVFNRELERFVDFLQNAFEPKDDEKFKNFPSEETQVVSLLEKCRDGLRKLRGLRSLDSEMLYPLYQEDGRRRPYSQRPLVIACVQSDNPSAYSEEELMHSVECGLGPARQCVDLKPFGVEGRAICISGPVGILVVTGTDGAEVKDNLLELVLRVFGSIRLSWHSMTVMNCYMGRQLIEISDQITRLGGEVTGHPSAEAVKNKLDELGRLTGSFYGLLMADDPLLNAVHFAPYSELFRKASRGYDFAAVKTELWSKLNALHALRGSVEKKLQYTENLSEGRRASKYFWGGSWVTGLGGLFYLAGADFLPLVGARPLFASVKWIEWLAPAFVVFAGLSIILKLLKLRSGRKA